MGEDGYKNKIKESLSNADGNSPATSDFEGTYLFFPFDLVNSTAFKNRNKQWGKLFDGFVSQSKILMEQEFPFIKIWKMVGDEILFYMQVKSDDDLHFAPKKTYDVLQKCIGFIEMYEGTKSNLSIKATIWSAVVYDSEDKNTEDRDNIIIKEKDVDDYILDFLGLDIDTGFRISKFVIGSVLVVDAKLACLIADLEKEKNDKHFSNFMRIVSYQQLKGVWDNRYYPIVWFRSEGWNNPREIFVYDERFNSEIVKQIFDTDEKCLEEVSLLPKIFKYLDKLDDVENLKKKIVNKSNPILIPKTPKDKLCEMHIVAICVNSNDEILIAKRAEGKNTLPNIWEFGCSQLRINQDFISAINKDYNNDFGIKLNLIENAPVSTYTMGDIKSRVVPGLIFVCRIEENENNIKLDNKKHSEYKFVNKENYKDIHKNEAVSDFHKRIEDTYKLLERNYKKTEKRPRQK